MNESVEPKPVYKDIELRSHRRINEGIIGVYAMKRFLSVILTIVILFASTCILTTGFVIPANAAGTKPSTAPVADNITVTNNIAGTSDTVYMTGLEPADVVNVYKVSSGGASLGKGTVPSSSTETTVKISQLGTSSGSIYVSVTSSGCTESSRTTVAYDAEPVSDPPDADNITVTNNAKGTPDTVYVCGLSPKDVVKVYNAAAKGNLLGSKAVSSSGNDITLSISQLGTGAGSLYVSVKSTTCNESSRTQVKYAAEAASNTLDSDLVDIINNTKGTADTISVSGLNPKDVVKVYNAATDGKLLGSATVSASGSSVKILISQLGTSAGIVYISVKSAGYLESSRVAVNYDAEMVSAVPDSSDISVTNNAKGTADTVDVQKLNTNDVVKVYSAPTGGSLLGKATATSTSATVSITQLGTMAGTVYVSVTSASMNESARVEADYVAEVTTNAPSADNIIVTNNPTGTADTVYVSGLTANDIVKVFDAPLNGTLLGKMTSAGTTATLKITQLGTAAGAVYVTVSGSSKAESSRTKADYDAETLSNAPDSSNITITNNASGTADTIYVSGLKENDVVNVYKTAKKGTSLGTATVASGKTFATVSIAQLGTAAGSVYVAVTSTNALASNCTQATYSAEATSTAPGSSNIIVTNNAAGTADTVYEAGLSSGDVVSVYKSASKGTALGTATVASGTTYATVSITQLGSGSGEIYVSVTSAGCLESDLTKVSYSAEAQTAAISSSSVSVTNNYGTSDIVNITGLTSGDIINVYDAATNGSLLGTATVTSYASTAAITIKQLGAAGGSIYVTQTSKNKTESTSTKVSYSAEPTSAAPTASNVTITNNANASDTITVIGLLSGDVVTVYKAAAGSTTLGTGTVPSSNSTVTITISQLGTTSGSVYISVTSTNMSESERTEVNYVAEAQSIAPSTDNITVVNNNLIASTITVTGLQNNDVVNIYKTGLEGTVLGTGTVLTYGSKVTISLSQLNASGGTIYVTVTSTNESESAKTMVTYSAQTVTSAPAASDVTIINNASIADTIKLKNVSSGMVINIYNAATGGNLLGTATSSSTTVTVSIEQLGVSAGSVYISATSTGKTESARTKVDYVAESASDAILAGNVTIVNNSGTADTITITGLPSSDVIKVYNVSSDGTAITTATATGNLTTVLTVLQLGTSSGSVYISVTGTGKTESSRTKVDYAAESTAPSVSNMTIVNNAGISDSITVTGLTSGDIVNVYNAASSGTLLGSTKVSASSTSATISVSQLSSSAGYAYISVTNNGCAESSLTKVSYLEEQTTEAPDEGDIYIINNASIPDTLTVYNLVAGDVIKVYDSAESGSLLGKATVASGSTSATITISELGTSAGSVYVSLKSKGKLESATIEVYYSAEGKSIAPYSGNITVVNNVSIADTVTVTGLDVADFVKVYSASSSGTLLGSSTVASGSSSVTISISQLGTGPGTVYVSVTKAGKTESDRNGAEYVSETTSNEVAVGNVTIVNNLVGSADSIIITDLTSGAKVQIYDASTGGSLLGAATVTSSGTVTIKISQLGIASGSVYITLTDTGKSESARTKVDFAAE